MRIFSACTHSGVRFAVHDFVSNEASRDLIVFLALTRNR